MDHQEEYLKLLFANELEIRAFIGSLVRSAHDCDDLFQEVALTLWKEFDPHAKTYQSLSKLGESVRRLSEEITSSRRTRAKK